jgi:hypothetical protein
MALQLANFTSEVSMEFIYVLTLIVNVYTALDARDQRRVAHVLKSRGRRSFGHALSPANVNVIMATGFAVDEVRLRAVDA